MSGDGGDLGGAWRSFYRDRCQDDLLALAEAYPQDRSLYVDVLDLYGFDEAFTRGLFAEPDRYLHAGTEALRSIHEEFGRVNLRLTNHPGLLGLDRLRTRHVGELVTVEAVAADLDDVQAAIEEAVFECGSCGERHHRRPRTTLTSPRRCDACGAGGPFGLRRAASTFVDVRRLVLEARPDEPAAASTPARLDALLDDDLVEAASPGDPLLATGVVRLERLGSANRFDFYLDVVSLDQEPAVRRRETTDVSDELQQAIASRWELLSDR